MNELLFEIEFGEKVTVTSAVENRIELSNSWSIDFFHSQDCCENVFAECDNVKIGTEMYRLEIKKVDGMGILLNGQLINCYNEQNGWYSDQLSMSVSDGNKVVFKCEDVPKEDHID